MGRPLHKKYFGNVNLLAPTGGEGIATVAAVTGLSGMTYLTGGPYTILAADIGAPDIAGGVKPVLTFQPTSATAGTVTIVSAGQGYLSAPTVTVRGSLAGGSGTATPTTILLVVAQDAIVCQGITSGTTNRTSGNDIIKQVSGRRYKIQTQDGTLICALKASAPTVAGEMAIVATDASSGTYYVTKLTKNLAVLARGTGTIYADGASVPWTLGTATATICKIPSA